MKITKQQVRIAHGLLSTQGLFKNEKNQYAATRNVKNLNSTQEKIENDFQDKRLELCLEDEKGCPVKDEKGNLKFKKEDEKKFTAWARIYLKEEVDFEPYEFKTNDEMKNLSPLFLQANLDFLLSEELKNEPEEKAEEKTEEQK